MKTAAGENAVPPRLPAISPNAKQHERLDNIIWRVSAHLRPLNIFENLTYVSGAAGISLPNGNSRRTQCKRKRLNTKRGKTQCKAASKETTMAIKLNITNVMYREMVIRRPDLRQRHHIEKCRHTVRTQAMLS